MAADMVQITTSAAPVCGQAGAQKVAVEAAAIETIKRGYDRFYIVGAEYQKNVGIVGTTPLVSNTTSAFSAYNNGGVIQGYGSSTTNTYGGQPIKAGTHDQGLVVKMLKANDPGADNAIDARAQLGSEWQTVLANGVPNTCQ